MKNKREFIITGILLSVGIAAVYFFIQSNIPLGKQITQSPKTQAHQSTSESNSLSSTLKAAIERVKQEGYTVWTVDNFESDEISPLNVLIGIETGSADWYTQRAFFFYKGKYLGTDASSSSAGVGLKWRNDKTIALEYELYHPNESMCCRTAGSKIVRFQWDGTILTALDPIPTDKWNADLSRR